MFKLLTSAALILAALIGPAPAQAATADRAHHPAPCAALWWMAPHPHRADGWTIRPRIVVDPHGVVRHSLLPSCAVEDASNGPVPCSWNLRSTDGNGRGLAYYVIGTHRAPRFRYVWPTDPTGARWAWVGTSLADALAEGPEPRDATRDCERCIVRTGPTTVVRCADGRRETS